MSGYSRRSFLAGAPALFVGPALMSPLEVKGSVLDDSTKPALWPAFPAQDPDRVRQIVGASHGNFDKVMTLIEASPSLANATHDWGYGDFETAIGAASHTGNVEIAEYLIEHGARPDLFTFAMFGQLAIVKACVEANPGIQRTPGPHGLSLLHHARTGKERAAAVVAYLEKLGDADPKIKSEPLTLDKAAYLGTYVFGDAPADRFLVEENRSSEIGIKRGADGIARPLFHQGDHAFSVSGSRGVRIRFNVEGTKAVQVTVEDPGPIVVGRRVG